MSLSRSPPRWCIDSLDVERHRQHFRLQTAFAHQEFPRGPGQLRDVGLGHGIGFAP